MATKKATYKYDNGTDWDEIMFKTTADQVVESTTKRFVSDTEKSNWNDARTKANDWDNFKNNGGIINSNFGVAGVIGIESEEAHFKSFNYNRGLFIRDSRIGFYDWEKSKALLVIDSPSMTSTIDCNILYAGANSINDFGYTMLLNGLIMQWGSYHFNKANEGLFEGTYSARQPISFPISFPNKVLNFSVASERVGNFGALSDITNSSATLFASSHSDITLNCNLRWIVIGY